MEESPISRPRSPRDISTINRTFEQEVRTKFPSEAHCIFETASAIDHVEMAALASIPSGFTVVAHAEESHRRVMVFRSATCLVKVVILRAGLLAIDGASSVEGQADFFIHLVRGSIEAALT